MRSLRLRLPDAAVGERVLLLKASRRNDLDISTFTAALWLRLEENHVADVRLAYGGVAPTVVRLPAAEQALLGTKLSDRSSQDSAHEGSRAAFERAGEIAAGEISPISDVRGAASYRRLLARNVLLRFHARLRGEAGADEGDVHPLPVEHGR